MIRSWLTTLLPLTIGLVFDRPMDAAERPNILFLMTDQQRWDSFGANGNRLVKTPNLDRLASQGANFTHAFVQSPVCVPSRISFFTGRYPHAHRNRVNYTPLDRGETLMQARLREAGYQTAAVGKLHYFPPTKEEAIRTGFDFVELHDGVPFTDAWSDYVKWRNQRDPLKHLGYRSVAKDIAPGKNPFRSAIAAEFTDTAWVGERTRHHLRQLAEAKRPFFLHASFWKPHAPFEVPEPYASMYDAVEFPLPERTTTADVEKFPPPLAKLVLRGGPGPLDTPRERLQWMYRHYYGTISHVDAEIGQILATLAELGLAENTIVVLSSDHGDQMLEHGILGKNCFFEASVRVPLLVSWPRRIKPAQHKELIEAVDLLPTLFELIGLAEPYGCQGRSFAPLVAKMERTYTPHDAVFSENIIPEVITDSRLDLSFEKGRGVDGTRHPDAKMVRTTRWKYNYYPEGYAELYDLENDPGERVNLAGQAGVERIEWEMQGRLLKWLTTAGETDQIAPRWLLPESTDAVENNNRTNVICGGWHVPEPCEGRGEAAFRHAHRRKLWDVPPNFWQSWTAHTTMNLPFELDTIQPLDCLVGMRRLPDRCVDIAIADPPYNLSKGGKWKWDNSVKLPGFGGNWTKVMEAWDAMPLADYFAFTAAWLAELKRVVKPTGSLWIHGTYHNSGLINFLLQALEIEIINEVVWFKRNSFPNLAGRRLTASHETILWAHTGKRREYHFNYAASKRMPCPEDSLKSPDKQMRTVWDIPNNKDRDELKFGKHPTQKPLRLLSRMLELSAQPDWICLVPFAGAGSECVAAKRAGLRFLAFETDRAYVKISRKRVAAENSWGRHSCLPTQAIDVADKNVRPTARAPSLIKWTGSKRSQAAAIRGLMPEYQRYFEPFLGGGAVLYLAACPGSVAGDIYPPLVELWRLVQADPTTVIRDYRRQWTRLQKSLPDYFYKVRERFNREQRPLDLSFLMRTCVNGIVRFNDEGHFNNSFHLSRKGMTPQRFEQTVRAWSDRLQGVRFVCQDYEATLAAAGKRDFVYLDPPYAGNKQRYAANLDLTRFCTVLEALNRRGVNWAWSFDGHRGAADLSHPVPRELYRRRLLLDSGNSAVGKVLNGPIERVQESLYLNYE